MKTIVSLLFLWFFARFNAQVHIVRDPIACAYGLKNDQNQWVVKAEYQQLLELEKGYFACQSGEKWGILKANGKTLLATKHDQISLFSPGMFLVVSNEHHFSWNERKTGIIDTAAHWLFPQEYASISRMQNNTYLLVKADRSANGQLHNQSAMADAEGKLLFPFIEGIMLNTFYIKPVILVGDNITGSFTLTGNVRLINNQGITISDSLYDMGMPCGENYIVVKKGRYGLLSAEGKTLVPPIHQLDYQSYDYQNPVPCIHGTHLFTIIENGKKGILNGEWQVIIPPVYEGFNPINSNCHPNTPARYIGLHAEEKKYHLLGVKGQLMLEADTIQTKMLQVPKTNYYQNDAYKAFFLFGERKNGQLVWGILSQNGRVLVPAGYNNILINRDFEAVLFTSLPDESKPSVADVIQLSDSGVFVKEPLTFLQKIDSIYLFQNGAKLYPFVYQSSSDSWAQFYETNALLNYGNYTLIQGSNNGIIVQRKLETVRKVKYIDLNNGAFPLVLTENGANLWHREKGPLLAQDAMQINQQFTWKNQIWAQKTTGKWQLYDTLGKLRTRTEFDVIPYGNDTLIAQLNYKKGVLDAQFNWIYPPVFSDIFMVTKTLFAGLTPKGKVAVLNVLYPEKIDSSFDSFTPLVYLNNSPVYYYSLKKNGRTLVYNERGELQPLTEKEVLIRFWTDPSNYESGFRLRYKNEQRDLITAVQDTIYNYLYPFYLKNNHQNNQVVTNGSRASGNDNSYQFLVDYLSSGKLSLVVYQPGNDYMELETAHHGGYGRSGYHETANWLFRNGIWERITFDELFKIDNARYQKVVLDAIRQKQDMPAVCLDCSTIFEQNNRFTFHENGIKLYFFEGEPHAFQIILTREQLEEIPSAKWIVPFL